MQQTDWFFKDRALILPQKHIAIVADLHLSGEMQSHEFDAIKQRLQTIIDTHSITTLILNGDTFNEFPFSEQGVTILQSLQSEVDEIILLEGNHESEVGGFGKLSTLFTTKQEHTLEYKNSTITITHGHQNSNIQSDVYIIGHLHPTTSTNNSRKPCCVYYEQSYSGGDVLVLPQFTDALGRDVNEITGDSPFLPEKDTIFEYDICGVFE